MPNARRRPLILAPALLVAACAGGGGPAMPTATPSATAPSSPSPAASAPPAGGIEHPTGATEIVLRYEEGGGFMVPEWTATQAPIFTLYGDGTVVFRDPAAQPPADENGLMVHQPFRTARLDEEQMQSLLAFAVNEGGLGVARDHYELDTVADAGTALFTINAGGRNKQVSVYALGLEDPSAADQLIRTQFKQLADRLQRLDEGGVVPTSEYQPTAWRVALIESGGVPTRVVAWPWKDLAPTDFAAADNAGASGFPVRVMSAKELAVLDLGDLKGGVQGLYAEASDGKIYSIGVRPLLPDEEA